MSPIICMVVKVMLAERALCPLALLPFSVCLAAGAAHVALLAHMPLCPPCAPKQPSRDELPTEGEEGLDAGSAGTPQNDREEGNDVPITRNWHYRLVVQKTLTGEIALRKWVTDQSPQYTERRKPSELLTHVCSFHDCGKAFPDASALRKHMHTHGEKQYVCQVEVRRPTRFRRVALAYSSAQAPAVALLRPSPSHASALPGMRQAVPRQLETEATLAHAHGGAALPLPLRGVRQALLARLQSPLAHAHPHGRATLRLHLSRRRTPPRPPRPAAPRRAHRACSVRACRP